jgi:hypothetical protein
MSDPRRDVFAPGGRKIQGARRVLPGDTHDDFLKWAHEAAGENPLAWQASARDLLTGATVVKAKVQAVGDGLMDTLTAVQAMLLGMALECLLKGAYIKRYRVWEEEDKAHALVKDGKLVRPADTGDHQLLQWADAAAVSLSQQERSALNRLTDFVVFAGRYPIPVRVQDMRPVKDAGGRTVARRYITSEELETAEALANRLMREVEPWR